MSSYRRVHEVFERVHDLPEPRRAEAVSRLCRGEDELEAEVNTLLDAMERVEPSDFLARPVLNDAVFVASWNGQTAGPAPALPGYEVGPMLGVGSAGAVYRARALGPLPRDVAIKVLRPTLPEAVVERFRREQLLLASLNHPGVAQVYDAGLTADGREFVAVEYIDGPPITGYAASASLSWRESVELVIRVCEAVQHIHANGVLHRDLKPANILVSGEDGSPRPKVIDFGAATSVGAEAALASEHPRFIGTVAYMAPEQLEGAGRGDARCDVYSLGLITHELLAGRHPFGAESAGLGELVRRIGAGRLPELPGSIGPDRGELLAVVRKACAREPEARYPSPQHLADDLRRVLAREPITARPPSALFRARAAVSRRPFTAAAGAAALAALVALGVTLAGSSAREARQNEMNRATLAALVDGVLDELSELDGTREAREHLTALLLERLDEVGGIERDPRLARLRARVRGEVGDLAFGAGDLERALALREEVVGEFGRLVEREPGDLELRRAAIEATVKLGDVLHDLGHTGRCRDLYEQAHRELERLVDRHPDHDGLLDDLTWSYERLVPFLREEDLGAAMTLAGARLSLAGALLARSPADGLRLYGLGCAEHWMGVLVDEATGPEPALPHADRACSLLDEAVAAEPHRSAFRARRVTAHTHRFQLLFAAGDPGADDAARRTVGLARSFASANPESTLPTVLLRLALHKRSTALAALGRTELAAELQAEADSLGTSRGD